MGKYFKGIFWVVVIGAVFFGGALIGLYTDWLWFSALGLTTLFSRVLLAKIQLGVMSGLLFFVVIYSNLWISRKIAPPPLGSRFHQQFLERLGKLARRGIGLAAFFVSIIISAMAGLGAANYWENWLKFLNATPFGKTDPLLHIDIGFYVFQLPFINYLYNWLFGALVVSTIAVVALYFADEAIDFATGQFRFAKGAKTHIFILIASMFFLRAVGYQLNVYDLLFSQGSLFDGAAYTDAIVRLPILKIMMVLSVLGGILVLLNIKARGIKPIGFAVGGLIAASILLSGILPEIVQGLVVRPNQLTKELPYIDRAIKSTLSAFGLENVAVRDFAADSTLTADQLSQNQSTIQNIRLWDKDHLMDVFAQKQTIQQYYHFSDVDVDRYWLTDKSGKQKTYRQVWLSPREIDQNRLPQTAQNWVNKALQYTHGYGFVMSPVNEVSTEGLPEFFAYDIPPKTTIDLPIDKMGIYFGEMTDNEVIVNTNSDEFDYPAAGKTVTTHHAAVGGVNIGNFFKRLLFALRFQDINILANQDFKPESEILYYRNIGERLRKLYPFLMFDSDPYLVTAKGNLYWMLDAYTTTDNYPYSKLITLGNDEYRFNYIRNSVKVLVDAYSGSVTAYVNETPLKDPIIQTYQKIFPDVFKPISEMPQDFRAHIRYPEDFFSFQTEIYKTYHMTDPTQFYNKSDLWDTPEKAELTGGTTNLPMDPYYVIMKLPNGETEEFILMTPFIRAGKANMVSWMCAKCDNTDYGRLVLYQFPKDKNVYGPSQIVARANQDSVISPQITLWGQQGSSVSTGNLMVIPIETSLLYVLPVYLESTSNKIPELKRVIVSLGNEVAMEPTLNDAIAAVAGAPVNTVQTLATSSSGGEVSANMTVGKTGNSEQVKVLVEKANSQYDKALDAQKKGNWAEYGRNIDALKQTLADIKSKLK